MNATWREIGDQVFARRYQPWNLNICVVRGADGLLVVDTRASHRQADELRDDLTQLGTPRWVVNTHAHFDHTFGNARFGPDSDLDLPIYGHAHVPAELEQYERAALASWVADGREPIDEWREIVITPPTRLVNHHLVLNVGERDVELVHLGRGHTNHDLLVHVPDADTWLVGDVIEESGPPKYGAGCYPLEWGQTVRHLLSRLAPASTVVPGHGEPVGQEFVRRQAAELNDVARLLQRLHGAGIRANEAVSAAAGSWPFPEDGLQPAVDAAYSMLDRQAVSGRLREDSS